MNMTIGERLQQHRKDLGLSQEELGQRLMVSRQTVSLWETDQTLPTIDNLLRLKELFGISVDELLEGKKEEQEEQEKPLESYCMTFSAEELKKRHKAFLWRAARPVFLPLLVIVCTVIIGFRNTATDQPIVYAAIGFFACMILYTVLFFIRTWKSCKSETERIIPNTYYYDVFSDYFVARIERNGETVVNDKVLFSEVGEIRRIGEQTAVQVGTGAWLFRTSELKNNSAIIHLRNEIVLRTQFTKATGIWRFLSIMLCILSVAVWPLAMQIITRDSTPVTAMELSTAEVFRDSWIAYLFLPIPVASIVFGFVLREKHFYYKKNIFFGILIFIVLCVFGSFFLIFTR
jgi:transcriptional regulator with XRE-family HTH domain